jgi:thiosulfate dehydrogenase [quinone] large subunit
MPVRFFVGREWLAAGEHKVRDDAWMDGGGGAAGLLGARGRGPGAGTPGDHLRWFRDFLDHMLREEWYTWFAKLVAVGEVLVGLGLIAGALVGSRRSSGR